MAHLPEDIRDKPFLNHKDILDLNFIRDPGIYLYRKHYRMGLRSHIMEVLDPADVKHETKGIIVDGLRWYPRAEPLGMLRIFRTRFNTLKDAEEELRRVKIIVAYLAPDHVAKSEEFLVDYARHKKHEILLCGLQEYVKGEVLEPWSHLDKDHVVSHMCNMLFEKAKDSVDTADPWKHGVEQKAENFIARVKQMILEANHVPDLAGVGNLILTHSGHIKLVDINNISKVSFDSIISLDDRGYPVCDKSIEALSLLEGKLLGRPLHRNDPAYKVFLDPERMKDVQAIEDGFRLSMQPEMPFSGTS